MIIRQNSSIKYYLQRKKVLTLDKPPKPRYEMQTLRPHKQPVTPAERLRPVESPGTTFRTEEL